MVKEGPLSCHSASPRSGLASPPTAVVSAGQLYQPVDYLPFIGKDPFNDFQAGVVWLDVMPDALHGALNLRMT